MSDPETADTCGVCGREFGETDVDVLVCGCDAPILTKEENA